MTNIGLLVGQRGLRDAQQVITQAAERLATGKRINSAADDPSGLIAADEMTQIITVATKKIEALDMQEAQLAAKEGAMSVVAEYLTELNGIVVQAANTGGLSEEEKEGLQLEAESIIGAIDHIANTATFKGQKIFNSLFSTDLGGVSVTIEEPGDSVGDDSVTKTVQATLGDMRRGGVLNLIDGDLEAAQKSVEGAIGGISGQRAAIGNQIRFDIASKRNTLLEEIEQHTKARSQIVDADIATEVSNLVRGQILEQASLFTMQFANQMPSAALELLNNAMPRNN